MIRIMSPALLLVLIGLTSPVLAASPLTTLPASTVTCGVAAFAANDSKKSSLAFFDSPDFIDQTIKDINHQEQLVINRGHGIEALSYASGSQGNEASVTPFYRTYKNDHVTVRLDLTPNPLTSPAPAKEGEEDENDTATPTYTGSLTLSIDGAETKFLITAEGGC